MDIKELAYYLFMEQHEQRQIEEVNDESEDDLECQQTTTTIKSDSKI